MLPKPFCPRLSEACGFQKFLSRTDALTARTSFNRGTRNLVLTLLVDVLIDKNSQIPFFANKTQPSTLLTVTNPT